MKIETRLYNLARNRDISLRMFKNLTRRNLINNIEKKVFKTACWVLLETIKTYELPRFVKNKKHLQQMLDGKFFLKKGDPGFKNLADQENVKYGGIVYIIRPIKNFCIFSDIIEEIYIGVTWKTLIDRFVEHTEDAINSYIEEYDWPNRMIEHLILRAMEDYFSINYSCNSEISTIKQFIESELLQKEKWERNRIIKNIAVNLYNFYFQMEVLEAHRNYETAWYRERWYIENYTRKINGIFIQGTLYPNGLNMMISPEKPGHRALPLYDIIFLVCLGFIGPEINEMISTHYHININFRTIYNHLNKFWENWDNVLKLFFRPVLQVLLQNEEYQWKDIAKSLHRAPSYRIKKNFREWFYGLNITQLRHIMKKEYFDWKNLGKLAEEFKSDLSDHNTVKGIPVDKWIEWLITDIGMEEISKILGYKNVESFRSSWLKQDRISIFQEKFGNSYTLAVIKYRKKRTIELLTDEDFIDILLDSRLYWIYFNEFGFMKWQDYAVDRPSQGLRNCISFFENLFKEEGLTAVDLENMTAFNYLQNLEWQNIVTQILES